MNAILDDPSDDTKGFFDPNTNENLTYLDLMSRCVIDDDTDLLLLPLYEGEIKQQYIKKYKKGANGKSYSSKSSSSSSDEE